MSEKLNQNALIKLLKITHYTLRKWEQDGMPYEMGEYGPHSNRYDVAEIMQWHINTGSGDADLENIGEDLEAVQVARLGGLAQPQHGVVEPAGLLRLASRTRASCVCRACQAASTAFSP